MCARVYACMCVHDVRNVFASALLSIRYNWSSHLGPPGIDDLFQLQPTLIVRSAMVRSHVLTDLTAASNKAIITTEKNIILLISYRFDNCISSTKFFMLMILALSGVNVLVILVIKFTFVMFA